MSQVKIYGLRKHLDPIKPQLSGIIHSCVMDALQYPADKRAHRFSRSMRLIFTILAIAQKNTILEFSMFEGRSIEAKKQLIRLLFEQVQALGITTQDLEITIFETPKHSWGFRGLPGDEHQLNYKVDV